MGNQDEIQFIMSLVNVYLSLYLHLTFPNESF